VELEAARALVPWWILPAAALAQAGAAFLGAFALGALLYRLARRAHRRNEPWPERARALYPSRVALFIASLAVPLSLVVVLPMARRAFLGGNDVVALSAAGGAALALIFWRHRLGRLLTGRDWTPRRAVAALATRALVMYPHLWVVLAVAVALRPRFDLVTVLVVAATVPLLLWLLRGGGFRIACAVGLAPPAPPEIAHAVAGAAARAGIPLAGVHQVDLPEVNAYALPFLGRIVFTRSALRKLDFASLLAVAQHELTHLAEASRARRTRAASLLVLAPVLVLKPLYGTGGLTGVLLGIVLALLIGRLLRGRLAALETRADAGAKAAEPGKGVYARALTEIYRLNLVPVVMRGTIHPHLYDRLVALGAPPAYPRPPAPSRTRGLALWGLIVACTVLLCTWGPFAAVLCRTGPLTTFVLDGGGARTAAKLALRHHQAGRYEEAATLYGAAAALEPDRPQWPAHQSISFAAAGRIEEAERAFAEAQRRGAAADLLAPARELIESRR